MNTELVVIWLTIVVCVCLAVLAAYVVGRLHSPRPPDPPVMDGRVRALTADGQELPTLAHEWALRDGTIRVVGHLTAERVVAITGAMFTSGSFRSKANTFSAIHLIGGDTLVLTYDLHLEDCAP